eukprot:5914771-Pleurochrysis_carterae.AAC.1
MISGELAPISGAGGDGYAHMPSAMLLDQLPALRGYGMSPLLFYNLVLQVMMQIQMTKDMRRAITFLRADLILE